jgi:hypothetical protein
VLLSFAIIRAYYSTVCAELPFHHDIYAHLHAGMNQITEKQMNEAEKQFKAFESMINSMTPQERSNPDLLAKVSHAVCCTTRQRCRT